MTMDLLASAAANCMTGQTAVIDGGADISSPIG